MLHDVIIAVGALGFMAYIAICIYCAIKAIELVNPPSDPSFFTNEGENSPRSIPLKA
jgi:hypothetical protein